jgi:hypothetical protein
MRSYPRMGSGDRCGLQFRDPGSDYRAVKERPRTNSRRAVEDCRGFVAAGSCVEFEHRGTEIRCTEFDSTFRRLGFTSAAGCIYTGVFLPAAEYCEGRSGGRRSLNINWASSSLHVRKCSPSPSGRALWPSPGH